MIDPQALASLVVPGPTTTSVTAPFWNAAAHHKLLVQQCSDCRNHVFYPRALCPHCWSERLEWVEASGEATLLSWTIVHRAGHPGWQAAVPYALGLIRLTEGPTMLTHLLSPPERLRLNLALRVLFINVGATTLPMFGPPP